VALAGKHETVPQPDIEYVRFRSRYPNQDGVHVGIFGLVNVLGRHGMLTPAEETFRRENNAWYDAAYPDPCTVDPSVYDRQLNPGASSWFKPTATTLLRRADGYLAILSAHAVAWQQVASPAPGRVVYEDEFHLVALPRAGSSLRVVRSGP
jgi:hypothetical protein